METIALEESNQKLRQHITAIRLMDRQVTRVGSRLKAANASWNEQIKDLQAELHTEIRDADPPGMTAGECEDTLRLIQRILKKIDVAKRKKVEETGKLKEELAAAEISLKELIRTRQEEISDQMSLPTIGGDGDVARVIPFPESISLSVVQAMRETQESDVELDEMEAELWAVFEAAGLTELRLAPSEEQAAEAEGDAAPEDLEAPF